MSFGISSSRTHAHGSLLYATFFAFPIAFEEIRGWNMGMTGVSFVSIIVSTFDKDGQADSR